jgi:hypothetical protein
MRARSAKLLVWLFNVVGSLDLIDAITLATVYDAAPFMGAAYWIPAFWVPALLVSHYLNVSCPSSWSLAWVVGKQHRGRNN